MAERTETSREPWWAQPPKPGQGEMDVEWGYLVRYSDGAWDFVHERPSDDEIKTRKGCRLG